MLRMSVALVAASLMTWVGQAAGDESSVPRPEHPRPDAMRSAWANLNGRWQFRFDAQDQGLRDGWQKPDAPSFDRDVVVPFPWESELSGIHQVKDAPKIGWYRRAFRVPTSFRPDDHVWLRFGAVDWRADVWVNGRKVAEHEGGYTPFEVDISDACVRDGDNVLVVRAFDPTDPNLPTGKQVGWYTPSSGIWQTVWLEARPKTYIAGFRVITTIQPAAARFTVEVANAPELSYELALRGENADVERRSSAVAPATRAQGDGLQANPMATAVIESNVNRPILWSPENPHLYHVTLELKDNAGKVIDSVQTYFGLRTIARGKYGDDSFERVLFNGKPIYLRTALDQSFNPKGLYTAPMTPS